MAERQIASSAGQRAILRALIVLGLAGMAMMAIPTLQEEAAKRPNRERGCLVAEQSRLINRMKSTLVRLGIRSFNPKLKRAVERLETLRTPEGGTIPSNTLAEVKRDMERRSFICEQIRKIEEQRVERLKQAPNTGPNVMVRLLARVVGIGIDTADLLVHEMLLRPMRDRRAVGRYGGLTGSPERSGSISREKGWRDPAMRVSGAPWSSWHGGSFGSRRTALWRNGTVRGPRTPRRRARP